MVLVSLDAQRAPLGGALRLAGLPEARPYDHHSNSIGRSRRRPRVWSRADATGDNR